MVKQKMAFWLIAGLWYAMIPLAFVMWVPWKLGELYLDALWNVECLKHDYKHAPDAGRD